MPPGTMVRASYWGVQAGLNKEEPHRLGKVTGIIKGKTVPVLWSCTKESVDVPLRHIDRAFGEIYGY